MNLSVKNICYTYPGEKSAALNRISFNLNRGSILGVAGSSGSGKSTLLNAIYGLIDLSEGEILFNGKKVSGPMKNLVPGHSEMRLAGQFHNLQSSVPVVEQIKYKLLKYEKSFRDKKAKELLSLTGLENYGNKLPNELSGGQQQLVNLCCALAEEPQLLLLDEPFNNLDQRSKKNVQEYLLLLREKLTISILIVSHDPLDLLSVSDKILILKDGKKIQQDIPEKIYFEPKNEYAAGLFGEINKLKRKGKNVFIRPSTVTISAEKSKGFIQGKIIERVFHGNHYQYKINCGKSGMIFVSSFEELKPDAIVYLKFC